MSLPWLALQTAYAHFAWAMVLAASGVGVLAWKKPLSMPLATAWVVLVFVLCALPGASSPSYWLNLAFHLPSPLCLVCSTMAVWAHAQGRVGYRVMPTGLALTVALAGAVFGGQEADQHARRQAGVRVDRLESGEDSSRRQVDSGA